MSLAAAKIREAAELAKENFHQDSLTDAPSLAHYALGKAISEYYGPDRRGLVVAFAAALEDANLHIQADTVRGWLSSPEKAGG